MLHLHNYLKKWAESTKQVILTPQKFFAKLKKRDEFGHSFRFVLSTLLLVGIFELVVFDLAIGKATATFVIFAFFSRLAIRVATFHLYSGLMHLMLHLFGSKNKYELTYHALAHYYPVPMIGSLLVILLQTLVSEPHVANVGMMMDIVAALVILFIIYVQTIALSNAHKMDKMKVLVATVIVPLVVLAALLFLSGALVLPSATPGLTIG